MPVNLITPQKAKQLLDQGAILVDVREADEHARERIPSAVSIPLSALDTRDVPVRAGAPVIFHCRSGARTLANARRLSQKTDGVCEAYVVEGGIGGLKKAGIPTVVDSRQPIDLQRQVQIGAGTLVLTGLILGTLVSPWFLAISAFVGAGLTVAGLTGFCGMARVLAGAPWNRLPETGRAA